MYIYIYIYIYICIYIYIERERETFRNFESSNVSRGNASGEIGRTSRSGSRADAAPTVELTITNTTTTTTITITTNY